MQENKTIKNTNVKGRLRGQHRGTERAFPRFDRHIAQAFRTFLCSGIGVYFAALQTIEQRVHRQNNEIVNRCSYQNERDYGVYEFPDEELAVVYGKRNCGEIGLSDDRRNQRREQIFHERRYNGSKGRAHHDRDCQIENVAAQNELSKAFHSSSYLIFPFSTVVKERASRCY